MFYGGTPWHWLNEAPLGLVTRCAGLVAKLSAEQSILESQRVAVGSGSLPRGLGAKFCEQWMAAMRDDEQAAAIVRPSADELRAMGITVFGPKPKA